MSHVKRLQRPTEVGLLEFYSHKDGTFPGEVEALIAVLTAASTVVVVAHADAHVPCVRPHPCRNANRSEYPAPYQRSSFLLPQAISRPPSVVGGTFASPDLIRSTTGAEITSSLAFSHRSYSLFSPLLPRCNITARSSLPCYIPKSLICVTEALNFAVVS
jgi:hypothetical protein